MSFSVPFSDVYRHLLIWVMGSPEEINSRTGHAVRVGRGGTAFRVDLSDRNLPTCGLRKTFPKSAAAETAWYISGTQDVTWMRQYAPLWDKFVEADGKTIKAAYGYRWREHFGRDQIELAIKALKKDPTDRRVYISAWDPAEDGLGKGGQRNVPCPVAFNLHISDGELHSTLTLRSSDVMVGLPYDVMGHALLMDAIAASLGVTTGVMHVALAHAHIYGDHFEIAATCINERTVDPRMRMPGWTVEEIETDLDRYVELVRQTALMHQWPAYNPKPFVVE